MPLPRLTDRPRSPPAAPFRYLSSHIAAGAATWAAPHDRSTCIACLPLGACHPLSFANSAIPLSQGSCRNPAGRLPPQPGAAQPCARSPFVFYAPLPPAVMWPARAAPPLAGGRPAWRGPSRARLPSVSHALPGAFFHPAPRTASVLRLLCVCTFAQPARHPCHLFPPLPTLPLRHLVSRYRCPPPPPGLSMPPPRRGLSLRSPPPGRPRSIVGAEFFSVCTPLSPKYVPPCTDECLPFSPRRCMRPTNAAPAFMPPTHAPYTPFVPPALPGAPLLPCKNCFLLVSRWQNPAGQDQVGCCLHKGGTGGSAHLVAPTSCR